MIDYHVHTRLCNHAAVSMESYIKAAIFKGMREICFLDHLTLQKGGRHLSMTLDEVPLYFQRVQTFKYRYADDIKIKVGLELDYHPDFISVFKEITDKYDFDLIGSSVHFLDSWNMVSRKSLPSYSEKNIDHIYGRYLEILADMVDCNYFDVVCHIDMVKKFGFKPLKSFDAEFEAILNTIQRRGFAVELNTSGYRHLVNQAYPSLDLLLKCRKKNIPITIGSDAHSLNGIGKNYKQAFSMLKIAGYTHLNTFTKRKKTKIFIDKDA